MKGVAKSARLIGFGAYAPVKILTNADLEKMVDTSDEWITSRTGIERRHVVGDSGQAASDLAIAAARGAIADANITPDEIDLIILGTVTGDMKTPSTAVIVQKALGAMNAAAMDINAACVGFLYGLTTARAFIESGMYKTVLVVGVEVLTSITNYQDRGTCVLFGDGAGAAIVRATDDLKSGILASHIAADGHHAELLFVKAGGSRQKVTVENMNNGATAISMNGPEIYKFAVRNMQDAAERVIAEAGIKPQDIDLVIPHQANIRIIDSLAKRLHVPDEKLFVNIQDYGNTSSASIPIAMVEARRQGRMKPGTLVLILSFGGGLVWGAILFRV
ncbi:MAG: beta-ketoacyl-ACP synthase III [Candidatus Zixiibacteriota bacterium]